MLYALMFFAGSAWCLIVVLMLALCHVAGRADRAMEQELRRGNVHYLRRVT